MQTLTGYEVVRFAPTEMRAAKKDDGGLGTLEVRFSKFGNWYRIASLWEGEFLERVERGAFAKTIAESGDRVRVLFDHGFDPSIGDKVLGPITDLREDKDAAVGVVDLFDTSYNRDLLPGLEAGVYGSSMRMVVTRDEWNDDPDPSADNPKGLPERTIKEVRLIEFGPVTFPANPESTSAMQRSTTDEFYERLRSRDPERVDLVSRARPQTAPHWRDAAPAGTSRADGAAEQDPPAPAVGHPGGLTPAQRRERLTPSLTKESAA
jgi:HK97 family phage prohead protease